MFHCFYCFYHSHRILFRSIELRTQCSANYVQRAGAGLEPREMKLTGSPETSKFPALSIIYSNCYWCWYAVPPDQTWRTTIVEEAR